MQMNSSKNYKVKTIDLFQKQVKRLIRKYPSLAAELPLLSKELAANPFQGDPLGHDCYKIRLAINSKGKGKSGGGRIIINVIVSGQIIFLLTIYDKSEKESISNKELLNLLSQIQL